MADPAEPSPALSLSAGSVLELTPDGVIRCAAEAGFPLAGVRFTDPRAQAPAVADAVRRTGVRLLDVEVVRLGPAGITDGHRRLADTAAVLDAAFLLTVSEDPDEARTTASVAALAEILTGSATRIALEPMAFTAVRSRAAAERIARAVPGTVVLPDALHLHRMREPLDAPWPAELVGYAQLTDVGPAAQPDGAELLAQEARHDRVPPGEGVLDLAGFLAALPAGVPLAVEVQCDVLAAEHAPLDRAVLLRKAAAAVVTGGS